MLNNEDRTLLVDTDDEHRRLAREVAALLHVSPGPPLGITAPDRPSPIRVSRAWMARARRTAISPERQQRLLSAIFDGL